MPEHVVDKGVKPSTTGIEVSIPNITKGDKVITFKNDSDTAKQNMADELMKLRKGGSLLSLRRGKELSQIHGYDPDVHAWIVGPKVKTAARLPVQAKDEVHVILPQSGG